jgi:hypothetical protein
VQRIHLFPVLRSLLLCLFTIYCFYLSTAPSMLGSHVGVQVLPFAFRPIGSAHTTDGVSVSVTVCHLFLTIFSFPLCPLWFNRSSLLEKAKNWCGFAVRTKIEDLISCLTLELIFYHFSSFISFLCAAQILWQKVKPGKRQKPGLSFCKLTSRPN